MSAETKLELLGLVDHAIANGWAHARACGVLRLADVRVHRWRRRLELTGTLEDRAPGGNPVHRILDWEERAILELIEHWGPVDRSHRKLAHRGSYTGVVFVSPSTLLRVAEKHRIRLPVAPRVDEAEQDHYGEAGQGLRSPVVEEPFRRGEAIVRGVEMLGIA